MDDKRSTPQMDIAGDGNVAGNGSSSQVVKVEDGSTLVIQVKGDLVQGNKVVQSTTAPATDLATSGQIGFDRPSRLDELDRESRARCVARWQAAGVLRAEALELTDDSSIGVPAPELRPSAEKPVLLLIGDFGAGKSLIGERLFQSAIVKARENIDAPVPVYLDARSSVGRLRESVIETSSGIGDPRAVGATVITDGADEAGVGPAADLLAEARVLVGAWPQTTVVITSRPIPTLAEVEEAVQVPPLSAVEAYALVSRFAGRTVTQGAASSWPESIRNSVCRPLFAVLLGSYFREQDASAPRSMGELLASLVERSLGRVEADRASANQLLQRLAVLSTNRGGGPVHATEVVSSRTEQQWILNSRLVVEQSGALTFPLPILSQWFAAQSLVAGEPTPDELANDPQRLECWRYPLIIFVSTLGHDQVSEFLTVLARKHPAFMAEIVKEGLTQWGLAGDMPLPPSIECGQRIRTAMQAWSNGLGPIAQLIAPLHKDGTLQSAGVRVDGTGLETAWYCGNEELFEVVGLPPEIHFFSKSRSMSDWVGLRAGRPGRQPAWPWRWTLDELVDALSQSLQKRALPINGGPLAREALWQAMLELTGRGSMYPGPIPLDEIEERLAQVPEEATLVTIGKWQFTFDYIRTELNRLREIGKTELDAPWPGPDREIRRGHWVWEPYTREQILARTKAVYAGALEGYQQLVSRWFPRLASRLQTAVTLPARLVGKVILGQGRRFGNDYAISWYLEALPPDSQTTVDLQFDERPVDRTVLQSLYDRVRSLRPAAAAWVGATLSFGVLDVFHPDSATELAYTWLWDDLKRISWVEGLLGS